MSRPRRFDGRPGRPTRGPGRAVPAVWPRRREARALGRNPATAAPIPTATVGGARRLPARAGAGPIRARTRVTRTWSPATRTEAARSTRRRAPR